MNTLRSALVPGLAAGLLSIFGSWLWMGVVFHRFQKETPGTWRPEGVRQYVGASLLHVFAALSLACLTVLLFRFNIGGFSGLAGGMQLAFGLWGGLVLPIILGAALFIRLHPLVVAGQLLDWLTVAVLACAVTGWWIGR